MTRVDIPTGEKALDDLGRNADLRAFHQDDPDSQQALATSGASVSYNATASASASAVSTEGRRRRRASFSVA